MAIREILIIISFAALVCGSEVDDVEQKKRGTGKTTTLNAIPTGAQKPEYTYSIYPQNPSSQNQQGPYQSQQVSNSFYPQAPSQYYTSANSLTDAGSAYPPQPQINLIPPPSSSQFVPLNFIPNPSYQPKLQLIPTKSSNGNIQLAILQQPSFPSPSILPYPQLFSPNPTNQNQQNQLLSPLSPQGQFNGLQNYPFSFGSPYLGQQSTMLLFAQPNPSLYSNLLYPNPAQSFYNYYPSNSQAKYSLSYGSSQPPTSEYDKGPITQNISKEDNDIGVHSSEYLSPVESNSNYKNSYASRSISYSKV